MNEKIELVKSKVVSAWDVFKSKKILWVVLVIVAIIIIIVVVRGGSKSGTSEIITVTKTNVIDNVTLSGRTQSASAVDLGFASQGRVNRVLVKEGDRVSAGQLLASIDTSDLFSNDLEKITKEQDALVANAYRNLVSTSLEAVADNVSHNMTPPIITGVYTGAQGDYRIRVYGTGTASGASFEVSGLESGMTQPVAPGVSVPLGTKGLYIQFASGVQYTGTNWTVSMPNPRSGLYATYLNAYDSARATRDRVITDAKASADSVASQVNKRKIYAPFAGVIAKVGIKAGESAGSVSVTDSASSGTITLISDKDYEVTLKVPEISVAKLTVGMPVDINLDAYGKDVIFPGKIISINPAETIVDGVPVYETKVMFAKSDSRIRSGMTATAIIIAKQVDAVLAVPFAAIHTDKNESYVYVMTSDDTTEKRIVTTGLRGSDSMVEIKSGLAEGDRISFEAL